MYSAVMKSGGGVGGGGGWGGQHFDYILKGVWGHAGPINIFGVFKSCVLNACKNLICTHL